MKKPSIKNVAYQTIEWDDIDGYVKTVVLWPSGEVDFSGRLTKKEFDQLVSEREEYLKKGRI